MAVGNSPKITLSENNSKRASLRGKTPSQLTIPELKGWLSCRKGAKLSEAKRSLVERPEIHVNTLFSRFFLCWKRCVKLKEINCPFQSSKLYRWWSR